MWWREASVVLGLFAGLLSLYAALTQLGYTNHGDLVEHIHLLFGLPFNVGAPPAAEYLLGVGRADITGPVVEINLMGYADPKQLGTGVRQRLYTRAFIIASPETLEDRIVYLVLDTQSGDTAVRYGVLQGLAELGPEYAIYNAHNVAVTGTHSHSGPGAWLNYLLPQITAKGFDKQSYQAIVDGTILAIRRAHESLEPGKLTFDSTEIEDGNINRSPYAYLANPAEEREIYETDVDKTMTLLRFERNSDGKTIGALNWFPVHGTSMLGNNTLITGDNKGVAAYLLEEAVEHDSQFAEGFVGGFSQSNVGDTSPNVLGAWCEDGSGQRCTFEASLCSNNRSQACHGRGPFFGLDDAGTKSCFEIGKRQSEGAKRILSTMYNKDTYTEITGPIRSFHTFRDFSNLTFALPNGTNVATCAAALGYSFAAGTTDGPGAFDFKQNNSGDPNASPLWAAVRNFLHEPTADQIRCHTHKVILDFIAFLFRMLHKNFHETQRCQQKVLSHHFTVSPSTYMRLLLTCETSPSFWM
jgi:neutral ceramidase